MKTCTQVRGGRGKKAPYKTTSVRCPEPIKASVMQLIQRFHAGEVAADDGFATDGDEVVALKQRIDRLEKENALLRKGYTKISLEFSTFKAKVVSLSYLAVVNKFGTESFDIGQLDNIGRNTVRFRGGGDD